MLCKTVLPFAFICLISACAAQTSSTDRFEFSVNVGDAISIPVEVFVPASGAPRAIVFVMPGTDGMSDPYLLTSLLKPDYRPDKMSGMTEVLLRSNYAVAYYNQRGLVPPKFCVAGATYQQRLESYADKCINVNIRANVSLSTITADTLKIFVALEVHPRLNKLPKIVLALSEGLYHVAQLVQNKSIQPIGIVSIGGPLESLADGMQYQLDRKYYFDLLETAFSKCNAKTLRIEQAFSCGKIHPTQEKINDLKRVFGSDSMSINDVAIKKSFFENETQKFYKTHARLPANAMTTLAVDSRIVAIWSVRFYSEIFAATQPVGEKLSAFKGGLVFLYGAEDHRSRPHKAGQCRALLGSQNPKAYCEIIVLEGLGHGLEDASGLPTKSALEALVSAIDNVSQSH
jgi:hypothetical protein